MHLQNWTKETANCTKPISTFFLNRGGRESLGEGRGGLRRTY